MNGNSIPFQVTLFTPVPIGADTVDKYVTEVAVNGPGPYKPVRPSVVIVVKGSTIVIGNTTSPVLTLRVTFFIAPNSNLAPSTCEIADNIASALESQVFAMSNYKVVTDVTHEPCGCLPPNSSVSLDPATCRPRDHPLQHQQKRLESKL